MRLPGQYAPVVQRLYTMFPVGTAGVAILILRALVATTFLVDGTGHWALANSFWAFSGFVLLALFRGLGLLTPYCSAISFLLQMGLLIAGRPSDEFHLAISAALSGILAFLGPGAYSIDAKIFGRRVLRIPHNYEM